MSQVTKRALEQSLKNLLLKKPLSKITISDLTEDCGICLLYTSQSLLPGSIKSGYTCKGYTRANKADQKGK